MNKLSNTFWLLILSSFLFPSCKLLKHKKSKKSKAKTETQIKQIDSTTTALKNAILSDSTVSKNDSLIALTKPIWEQRVFVKTLSTKAKMHYEGADKSYDFVANIRMKQDSIIWISVSVAGIVQVARAIITPDSFKAILYTENTAYEGPIEKVNDFLPAGLDFYSFQNLILGNPILRNGRVQSVMEELPNWLVRLSDNEYLEQLKFGQSDSNLANSQLVVQGNVNRTLVQALKNYTQISEQKIATGRVLNILNDGNTMLLEIDFTNIVLDNELSYPFNIPSHYTIK